MTDVYLLLGSNQNNRQKNIELAQTLIRQRFGEILKQSNIYETEAWGLKEQNSFLNQAILITTTLLPAELLSALKNIEKEIGRTESVKWGPRIIDMDIIFYGNEIVKTDKLIIPHALMPERKFTLTPLNEIAQEFIHPILNKSVNELLLNCSDKGGARVFSNTLSIT